MAETKKTYIIDYKVTGTPVKYVGEGKKVSSKYEGKAKVKAYSVEDAKGVFKYEYAQKVKDKAGFDKPRLSVTASPLRGVGGGSSSGVKQIQPKMLTKPKLKRPGGK